MFVYKVILDISGGKGGDGARSFRRTRSKPKGGPDGGNGGDGGKVIIRADHNYFSLDHLRGNKQIKAGDGENGGSNNKTGQNGKDVIIDVPCGTKIIDNETKVVLKDLNENQMSIIVANGGKGGKGNINFKSSVRQQPQKFTAGERGEHRQILLELTSIADIGLVGLPNAGKTTLINTLASSKYKTAGYKFTTSGPQPAVIFYDEVTHPITIMDIPGIIEGASKGKGRGLDFLSQIERTKSLMAVIDLSYDSEMTPETALQTIRNELEKYSEKLASKIRIIAFNKVDLVKRYVKKATIKKIFPGSEAVYISALKRQNIRRLKDLILKAITTETLKSDTQRKQVSR